MMERLTRKQTAALKQLLYTDMPDGIHPRTLKSLRLRGLISGYRLTDSGCDALNLPKVEITPEMDECRKVQDELIDLIIKRGFNLTMRLSNDLPPEIDGLSLQNVIYPQYLSDLKRMLVQLDPNYTHRN